MLRFADQGGGHFVTCHPCSDSGADGYQGGKVFAANAAE